MASFHLSFPDGQDVREAAFRQSIVGERTCRSVAVIREAFSSLLPAICVTR